jgi:hypothetical protein
VSCIACLQFNLPGSFDYKDSSLSNPQGSYTYAYTKWVAQGHGAGKRVLNGLFPTGISTARAAHLAPLPTYSYTVCTIALIASLGSLTATLLTLVLLHPV